MANHRATDVRASMGLSLPPVPEPVGAYVPAVRTGNLVFTAGQIPTRDGQLIAEGRVPDDVAIEAARRAARQCVLNGLAAVLSVVPSLDDVIRIVRMNVYVASSPRFTDQAKVANEASEFLVDLFGRAGKHTRCAVGVASLPLNAPVELDLVVELAKPAGE